MRVRAAVLGGEEGRGGFLSSSTRAAGPRKIKEWVDANGFLSAFIPAILPPPFPFKPFVLAEGVFQVPARTFIVAILLGRGLRYGVEGFLAVRYGVATLTFMKSHGAAFVLGIIALVVVFYIVTHFVFRGSSAKS